MGLLSASAAWKIAIAVHVCVCVWQITTTARVCLCVLHCRHTGKHHRPALQIASLVLLTSPELPDRVLTSSDHLALFLTSDSRHRISLDTRGDAEEEVVELNRLPLKTQKEERRQESGFL